MSKDEKYVTGIPRKLPKDRVLVHNHVVPQPVLGPNGFRAWTQTLSDDVEVCSCDWAGVDGGVSVPHLLHGSADGKLFRRIVARRLRLLVPYIS